MTQVVTSRKGRDTMKRKIRKELLDELLADYRGPADMTGPDGLLKQLTDALVERALAAELTDHLGDEPGEPTVSGNARNGTTPKTLTTDQGEVAIETPRDRDGTFEPRLVKKHQRRFTGFDDKILSMYARGMSVRDIQAHLSEIYGTDISPSLISTVTDAVVDEVAKWQARPLDAVWPILYLDAIVLKVRDQGVVQNKHVYMALGINLEGKKEVLGLWIERYPMVAQAWRSNWERVRPFFAFGKEVRKIIYTTNAIESLNFTLRKVTKARGHFPSDEAALKLVYLGIRNMEKKWTRQPKCWNLALNQFSIMFEGRLPA